MLMWRGNCFPKRRINHVLRAISTSVNTVMETQHKPSKADVSEISKNTLALFDRYPPPPAGSLAKVLFCMFWSMIQAERLGLGHALMRVIPV